MFEQLTRILLWLLLGLLVWYVLRRLISPAFYNALGFVVLALFLVLAFLNPTDNTVSDIWSILSLPLTPLGVVLLGLALTVPRKDFRVLATSPIAWVLVFLYIASTPFVAYYLSQRVEAYATELNCQTQTFLSTQDAASVEGIVVLAQNTTRPGLPPRPLIELTESGDRLRLAADLYDEYRARVIALAGERPNFQGGNPQQRSETTDVVELLVQFGVPQDAIISDDRSESLRESTLTTRRLLQNRPELQGNLILVTSALSVNRARLAFEGALSQFRDVRILPLATDFQTTAGSGGPRRRIVIQDMLPSAKALVITTEIIQEYFGSLYYFLRGWLGPNRTIADCPNPPTPRSAIAPSLASSPASQPVALLASGRCSAT
ncbi:YdcF family protein [Geitlerinema sp. PCC 7407]|uniref:YdcF family protein n=1 Tax=Geitlerinema sp. PCC 7407 TaxID=1173025 RepID=UPI00029FF357|nr:YdcF family protein [Geitlerinema sp. PCC 7407]AFY66103.1 protein of unknown function DUF218 [Geitlerinema sp. PCC 7407]